MAASSQDQLRALADAGVVERASRLTGAETRLLPVLEALEAVLPEGGLRRGTTLGVGGIGATSLGLALVAHASRDAWACAVGLPSLGLVWASEIGVALDRLVVVPDPGRQWLPVLAAVADAFDIVVTRPARVAARDARKLSARVREQRSVLVCVSGWPEADLHLQTTGARWFGIDGGHGHLAARLLTIRTSGRGAASRPREVSLWLPDEHGRVSLREESKVVALR